MRIPSLLLSISVLALAACGESTSEKPAVCGDGVVSGDEACDDGNTIDDDQCSNECRVVGCGDGVVSFLEACDDGNTIDGDGCDSNCTQSYCGNGILAGDEECDDGNTRDGDGCDSNCRPSACGNGAVGGNEQCDDGNNADGDGCDSNCTTSACGNGIKAGAEQCDDGNSVSADGCSSNCVLETLEMEPNDDGMVSTGGTGIAGNDFAIAAADANGALTKSATIIGSLMPVGDEDVFKVTNPGPGVVRLAIDSWNFATGFGIGTSCGTSIDTGINVRSAAGTVLTSNNDRMTGDRCAGGIVYPLFPGDTVYVHITENGDNAVVASYALEILFRPVVCGDGDVGPGEQCDDGNTAVGDGCSATCQIENAFTEVEPNEDGSPSTGGTGVNGNDFSATNANGPFSTNTTVVASIMPTGDEDVFAITNPSTQTQIVKADVWNLAQGYGIGVPCGSSIDTGMSVRDASGTQLVSNDDRTTTTDLCSTITTSLAPGQTRYVHVVEFGDNAQIALYALKIVFTPVVCGDMTIGPGEQCDDGNTMSGDGCSAMCQIEPICGDSTLQPTEQCDDGNVVAGDGCDAMCQLEGSVAEVEPNEDGAPSTGGSGITGNDFSVTYADMNTTFTGSVTIAARLDPMGDEDVFKFTNPGSTYAIVTFDTWNTAPNFGIGVSCGTSIDTGITLRNAAGLSQASNNDRISSDRCSSVSYNLPPGGIIYAHVVENGDNAVVARYALKVAYTPVVCGDMMVGPGEQCDDGNTMPGDGCDAMCIIEPTCGNSMLENAEQCDDGNTLSGDNCSSTCQLENAVTESEPNEDGTPQTGGSGIVGNDFSIANANGPFTTTTRIAARISPVGDEDVFKITNPGTTIAIVTLNTYNLAPAYGFGVSCGSSIDTVVHLRDAAAVSLASNDDRSTSPIDRCSSLTYNLAAGASVYAHVTDHNDDTAIASYALVINIAPVVCGDGTIGPGEVCDDGNPNSGDGCSSTCQRESICGNGVVDNGEQCDDHNTVAGDGCSATCQLEGAVSEIEPNDDGTPQTGGTTTTGNDFSSANANGPFSSSTTLTAALSPTGDEDVFAFTNPGATWATLTLDVWNLAEDYGIGVSCGSSIDTAMHVRNATGTSLALNDNRSSTDKCSALTYLLTPGQTVYVHISEYGDNAQIASYALVAKVIPTICGDGQIGPGEQCDDGNTTPGDGCSATCQVPQEIEPNDTTAQAMSSPLQVTGDALIGGAIATAADKDFYQVTVAAPTVVRFESFTAPNDCATATTINLRLLDSTGTLIVEDTGAGLRSCGAIVMPLAAGTYFIQVEEQGNNATIASYMLEVAFQDDVGTETEPNETVATASVNLLGENDSFVFGDHMMSADADVYSIVVPSGRSLRAEVIEGDRASETCESNGIDSKLTLLDETGATLTTDDDDGRGFCSKLDGTGPSPDDSSARNTTPNDKMFYIRVEKSGSASTANGQFVYRLQVTIR